MNINGSNRLSHLKKPAPANTNKEPKKNASEEESSTLTDKVADFAGDTVRTVGGTAAVALKSTSLLTSSVLQGFGMEEEKADRLGTVASLASFGVAVPVAMGTGVVGTVAVKGLGLGKEESESTIGGITNSYAEGVNEAYSDGEFAADSVMEGARKLAGKTQDQASSLGEDAAEGLGKAVDYGKRVAGDVVDVAKDAGDFLLSVFS